MTFFLTSSLYRLVNAARHSRNSSFVRNGVSPLRATCALQHRCPANSGNALQVRPRQEQVTSDQLQHHCTTRRT